MEKTSGPENKKNQPGDLWELTTVGLTLVFATFIGLATGLFLDKYLGTKPWLTVIFLVLGIVSGFMNIYRTAKRINK